MEQDNEYTVNKKNAFLKEKVSSTEELSAHARWSELPYLDIFQIYIHSNAFNQVMKFSALTESKELPKDEYLKILNQFLALKEEPLLALIKKDLWKFCDNLFGYMKCETNTEGKTNYEFLNIHTAEDAYKRAKITEVVADLEDGRFEIKFDIDLNWEDKYVFSVTITDGQIDF